MNKTRFTINALALLVLSFAFTVTAAAQWEEQQQAEEGQMMMKQGASSSQLVIHRAEVDQANNLLTITGVKFGDDAPEVRLEGVELALISHTPTQIVALLPARRAATC